MGKPTGFLEFQREVPQRRPVAERVNDFFDVDYRPVLKAVCGRTADGARAFAEKWGYESIETDWRKLVERKDIDLIDICTPNNTHAEIALAAATPSRHSAVPPWGSSGLIVQSCRNLAR